ncbi:MAG: 2Fe-2S iron-sulfur cluster-binding protein [Thermostichales cyanobacterium BF4_bins_65]
MSGTYQVTFHHRGTTTTITAPADVPILETALQQGLDLPYSCSAGVCTTCAARIRSGSVQQPDAMGIAPKLQAQGYVLLCVAYPTSDLEIETDKEEEVYYEQFGKAQQK